MSELAAAELLASAPRMSILDAIFTKPKSVYAISRDIPGCAPDHAQMIGQLVVVA